MKKILFCCILFFSSQVFGKNGSADTGSPVAPVQGETEQGAAESGQQTPTCDELVEKLRQLSEEGFETFDSQLEIEDRKAEKYSLYLVALNREKHKLQIEASQEAAMVLLNNFDTFSLTTQHQEIIMMTERQIERGLIEVTEPLSVDQTKADYDAVLSEHVDNMLKAQELEKRKDEIVEQLHAQCPSDEIPSCFQAPDTIQET